MSKLLLRRAGVITLDQTDEFLPETDIAIRDGQILAIGTIPQDFQPDQTTDLSGHVVMPGFWNAHTHAAMTFTRSIGDDLPLERWFNEKVWVAESGLTEQDVYWGGMLAAAEMIRSGTVGFADHYFHMERMAVVVGVSGLKALLAIANFGDNEVSHSFQDSVAWATNHQNSLGGRLHTALGPHAPYTCSPEFLVQVADAAVKHNLGIHIHLAESQAQVNTSLEKHGKTPVALLHHLGLFQVPLLAAHCIAVNDQDLDLIAAAQVTPISCPRTHMKFGFGATPIPAMTQRGIKVALGTDGAGSNNQLNMLESARLALLQQRFANSDGTLLPGDTPLRMAATHGAHALGFKDSGKIKVGQRADLIAVNTQQPHLQPALNMLGNIIHAAQAGDITHTMVEGKWLMENRQLTTLDEERILAHAAVDAPAMIARGRKQLRKYET